MSRRKDSTARRQARRGARLRQIIDRNPFLERVLAPRFRPVSDRRHVGERRKAIAIVHEGLGAGGQWLTGLLGIGGLEGRDERIVHIERKGGAHQPPFHHARCATAAATSATKSWKLRFTAL